MRAISVAMAIVLGTIFVAAVYGEQRVAIFCTPTPPSTPPPRTPPMPKGLVIFRPSTGLWAIRGVTRFYFGEEGDQPLPGSYVLGSNNIQAAIFRPSTGLWAIRGVTRMYFGRDGDIAIDLALAPMTTPIPLPTPSVTPLARTIHEA